MKKKFISTLLSFVLFFTVLPKNFLAFANSDVLLSTTALIVTNYSLGSATFIDSQNGYLLTNYHVIEDELLNRASDPQIYVCIQESYIDEPGCYLRADYIVGDKNLDIAILKPVSFLDETNTSASILQGSYPQVSIEYSSYEEYLDTPPKVGDAIQIVGYPAVGGVTATYTTGSISGYSDQLFTSQVKGYYLKTDTNINPGNSGGGAYDENGNYIGITTAVVSDIGNIGYVISIGAILNYYSSYFGSLKNGENIEIKDNQEIIDSSPVERKSKELIDVKNVVWTYFKQKQELIDDDPELRDIANSDQILFKTENNKEFIIKPYLDESRVTLLAALAGIKAKRLDTFNTEGGGLIGIISWGTTEWDDWTNYEDDLGSHELEVYDRSCVNGNHALAADRRFIDFKFVGSEIIFLDKNNTLQIENFDTFMKNCKSKVDIVPNLVTLYAYVNQQMFRDLNINFDLKMDYYLDKVYAEYNEYGKLPIWKPVMGKIVSGDPKTIVKGDRIKSIQIIKVPFADTKGHINEKAINYLKEVGVIDGYPDGTFKPENTVNRAELLKILVEGKGFTPLSSQYNNCFKDIGDDEWFVPYVCYSKSIGWINGYPDGTFKPDQAVNKVEALKMLLNSQEVKIPEVLSEKPFNDVLITDWFAPYVAKAEDLGILEETGMIFSPSGGMTRGGICENLYRLLTY